MKNRMQISYKKFNSLIFLLSMLSCFSCSQDNNAATSKQQQLTIPSIKYLYVSAGLCYSGGNTTFTAATASNVVYRINTLTGVKDITIADYNAFPANSGDTPISAVSWDSDNVMILVENATTGRRIEKAKKLLNSDRTIFTTNTTILSGVLKSMVKASDGSLLVSKTNSIEKISSSGVRIGAPLIPTALGTTCGTANALMSSMVILNNGNIVFTNAAASNNRTDVISAGGYLVTTDCLSAQTAPNVNSYPTASVYVSANKQLIVAYAGTATTTAINSIYVYDVDETTNVLSNATKIYDANLYPSTYNYLLYGISAMAYDASNKNLYVATATSTATTVVNYTIEKLSYNPATKALSRGSSTSFYNYGVDTKCISSMFVE